MARREDSILRLCSDLLAKRSDEDFGPLIIELREALHQHIENLRESLGSYPLLIERACQNDIRPHNKHNKNKKEQDEGDAAEESRGQPRIFKRRIA